MVSLRRCHDFAGPDEILITVVSPTDPDLNEVIKHSVKKEDLYDGNWVKTVKDIVKNHQYILDDTKRPRFQESKLTLYMRTTDGNGRHTWYNSHKVTVGQPSKDELIKAPEFFLTGYQGTWPG
eukprot:GHVU01172444.1.p1 GENE.GHVU01172444.1~~GHVU01172444.1.p1  ORF type:complete len:123 (-),score=8.53 GHVU01172444.1:459-827(-)